MERAVWCVNASMICVITEAPEGSIAAHIRIVQNLGDRSFAPFQLSNNSATDRFLIDGSRDLPRPVALSRHVCSATGGEQS